MSLSTRKGTIFETSIIPLLDSIWPDTIRLGKQGVCDKGDFHMPTNRTYIAEAKNCRTIELAKWQKEAEREAANKGVPFGIIIHKRRGIADPAQQWVTMTLGTFKGIAHGTD